MEANSSSSVFITTEVSSLLSERRPFRREYRRDIAPRRRRRRLTNSINTKPAHTQQKDIKRTNAALIKAADVGVTRNYATGATAEISPLSKKYFAEVCRKSKTAPGCK